MKILLLQNLDMGLYFFRKELIEFFIKENDVYYSTPKGNYTDLLNSMGCHFIPCNMLERKGKNPISDLKLMHFYYKTIKSIKPDIVLMYTLKPLIYGGIACRITKVHYFPNITGMGTDNSFSSLLNTLLNLMMKIAFKNADCIFFQNSEAQNNMLSSHIVKGRNRLLPGSGVNLNKFMFSEYPDSDKEIRFLFVGRIRKDKGIEEFLYAIRKLHNERKEITADIIGDLEDDYKKELFDAKDEGAITIHGLVKNVIPFYVRSHCVVLPSYHEGMSNALLEAASVGRPIITSNIPGCKETVDNNVSGFVVNVRDKNDLYEKMRRFCGLDYEKKKFMAIKGREKMEKEFDRNIVIKAYYEEIQRLRK